MNREKARQYFLANQNTQNLDESLSNKLNDLSLFQNKTLNISNFMQNLTKIISWNTIHNIQYAIDFGNEQENIELVIKVQSWAKQTFSDALQNGNLDKLILSYMMGYYLLLDPIIDFTWGDTNDKIEEKLKAFFSNIKLQIVLPENAPYSEKKYFSDYKISSVDGELRKLFDFISFADRGRGSDYLYQNFIKALTNICYKINLNLISDAIADYEPMQIWMIFKSLNPFQANELLKKYNSESSIPLLVGLIYIINPSWNNEYNTLLENDYSFLNDAALILKKISDRVNTDNLFKLITDSTNISSNKLWHSIFITFAVQNTTFLDSYIDSIDFSYNAGAENVFNIFCQSIPGDDLVDDFSVKIYDKFLDFLIKERGYKYNFCGTNYLEFMIRAVYVKSEKSHVKYNKMLNNVSNDFERELYSWNNGQITMYFTRLIFWALALMYYKNNSSSGEMDLSYAIEIFSNEKYMCSFDTSIEETKINFRIFADYLRNPTAYICIVLPLSNNSYTTIEFNKNT